jgi:hypothetical protein
MFYGEKIIHRRRTYNIGYRIHPCMMESVKALRTRSYGDLTKLLEEHGFIISEFFA